MQIIKGRISKAQKVVIYGPEGIGKSTFAAQFPDPVFIDTEGSTNNMNVNRFPRPSSWTMLTDEVEEVLRNPEICRTLVIDTTDWAERLCIEQTCAKLKISGIEDLGYGKGYVYVAEEFGKLLNLLEDVTRQGIHVVLTAHAIMRKFEQPDELGAYDRWELKLSKKVAPMVKEWSDMLLFANYQTHVTVTKDNKRKASGGERVMYTTHHACWDAKNRMGMSEMLPFDYAQIQSVIEQQKTEVIADKPHENNDSAPVQPLKAPEKPPEISDETPEAPEKKEAPSQAETDDYSGVPTALKDLMQRDGVTTFDLRAAVSSKGYYSMSTPVSVYDPDFVQGCLIGAWPQVLKLIQDTKNNDPF